MIKSLEIMVLKSLRELSLSNMEKRRVRRILNKGDRPKLFSGGMAQEVMATNWNTENSL